MGNIVSLCAFRESRREKTPEEIVEALPDMFKPQVDAMRGTVDFPNKWFAFIRGPAGSVSIQITSQQAADLADMLPYVGMGKKGIFPVFEANS